MKKNVKRFVSMTMAMLVAAGSLAGCGGGGSASTGESAKAAANTGGSSGGAVTVKVSLSQAATEPPVKAAEYFKEIVEERSNGEIKVEVYPDNQLGNERDVIEGMQLGTVEMAMTSVAPFSSFVPSVNIFCLPFLWRDKEHMYSVLDSDEIGMSYSGDCEEKGFHLMGFQTYHDNAEDDQQHRRFKEPQDPYYGKSGTAGFLYRIRRKPVADGIRRIIHSAAAEHH